MKFTFYKKSNIPKHKKDGRIDPHRFMLFFMSFMLFFITLEILFFTYFFILSSRKLDSEVLPSIDISTGQIEKIESLIKKTEETVSARQGIVPSLEVETN